MTHADILTFAERKVNLHRDAVSKYRAQVAHLHDELATYIGRNQNYDLKDIINFGSVAKGTALSTISDMDVAVYVRKGEVPTDPKGLLEWMASRLREVYPTMAPDQFRVQSHSVRVSYKGSGLDLDVVPILYTGLTQGRGHLLTKETGQFLLTSVPLHLEFIRKRKERIPNHFAQVIRLLKWWVQEQGKVDANFRLKSFLVELIVASLTDRGLIDVSNYPLSLQQVFAYIVKNQLGEVIVFSDFNTPPPKVSSAEVRIYDPVNSENNVAENYTRIDLERIVERAREALDALSEAHHSDTRGRAIELWQTVLGPSFGL